MTYKEEFPDFDRELEFLPTFEDSAWHNDSCPCMISNVKKLLIYCDYTDPARREYGPDIDMYSVHPLGEDGELTMAAYLLSTDSWDEVKAFVEAYDA